MRQKKGLHTIVACVFVHMQGGTRKKKMSQLRQSTYWEQERLDLSALQLDAAHCYISCLEHTVCSLAKHTSARAGDSHWGLCNTAYRMSPSPHQGPACVEMRAVTTGPSVIRALVWSTGMSTGWGAWHSSCEIMLMGAFGAVGVFVGLWTNEFLSASLSSLVLCYQGHI